MSPGFCRRRVSPTINSLNESPVARSNIAARRGSETIVSSRADRRDPFPIFRTDTARARLGKPSIDGIAFSGSRLRSNGNLRANERRAKDRIDWKKANNASAASCAVVKWGYDLPGLLTRNEREQRRFRSQLQRGRDGVLRKYKRLS